MENIKSKNKRVDMAMSKIDSLLLLLSEDGEVDREAVIQVLKYSKSTLSQSKDQIVDKYLDKKELSTLSTHLGYFNSIHAGHHEVRSIMSSILRTLSSTGDSYYQKSIKEDLSKLSSLFESYCDTKPSVYANDPERFLKLLKETGSRRLKISGGLPEYYRLNLNMYFVLKNLIRNGLIHSEGMIELKYNDEINGWLVKTEGAPLDEVLVDNMYRMGVRGEDSRGDGVGLYLSKFIADTNGLNLVYDKDKVLGEGNTFVVCSGLLRKIGL